MKTKILFTSMVLPTLFAACTAEEFAENQNVSAGLEGRALLNPITVTIENGKPDSRFSWNEEKYEWNQFTAEDKFSAGLVDNINKEIGNDVLTNYIFSSEDGKNYTTTSQMVEGAYLFYSYTGFETSASRGPIAFDLTSQDKIDLSNPAATVENNKFFIAPLYRLEKETANNSLGLQFVSYWSTAAIKVANTSKQNFKIIRMAIVDDTNTFAVKGTIAPTVMEDAHLVYSYNEESGEYELPVVNGKQVVYDAIRTADLANTDAQKVSELVVDCQSYELQSGKDVTAYIQVPAGQYDGLKLQLTIEVVEGKEILTKTIEKPLATNVKVNNVDKTQFSRGKTTAIFGIKDEAPAAYEIDDIEIIRGESATGKYASTYEDMYKYLTEAESGDDVPINNFGSLKLDDQLISLINRLDRTVEFTNPIEITTERGAEVTKVKFTKGATLAKGTVTFADNVTVPAGQTLTVAKDTKAIFEGGIDGNIYNNATIELYDRAIYYGTISNASNSTVILAEGVYNYEGFTWDNAPSNIVINKGVTLQTESSAVIPYTVSINNYGILGTITVNGTVDNYGTIAEVTLANDIKNIDANNVQIPARINNYGTITKVNFGGTDNNEGVVVMMNKNASIATATGSGLINNTEDGFITTIGGATVYAEYEGDKTGVLGNSSCTKVVVKNGTWTNPSLPSSVTKLEADKVTMSSTAAGKAINLNSVETLTLTNSEVNGNLTVKGNNSNAPVLNYTTFNGKLVLTATTTLNLVGVTFNDYVTASAVTAFNVKADSNKNGDERTVINAAVTMNSSSSAISVAEGSVMEVTANGSIGDAANTTIKNEGTVENKGTIKASSKSGNGIWKGTDVQNS